MTKTSIAITSTSGRGRAAKPTKAPVVAKPRARAAPTSPVKV